MNRFKPAVPALLVGAFAFVFLAGPVQADMDPTEAGVGVATAAATLIYSPVKVVYSVVGVIFGGVAYGLSGGDSDVMQAVMTPAIHGDYVLTPEHLLGKRSLEFFGREPDYREDVVYEDNY